MPRASGPETTLKRLHAEAEHCRACPLWKDATQVVFGEGPANADIMFVGEQPGDKEDLAGKPFVGPAGQMFDRALKEAGIARDKTYVTNAVKHFKFVPRGKIRLHRNLRRRKSARAANGTRPSERRSSRRWSLPSAPRRRSRCSARR